MWIHKNTYAIGGLHNIGYAPGSDILIVLSSQGQGIFDCIVGEKVARQYDDEDWWDRFDKGSNSVMGFGLMENIEIPTSGLYGGDRLSKETQDGWTLVVSEPFPEDEPFEMYMARRIYLVSPDQANRILVGKDGACELRAFGFSSTGNSFVIGLSCELVIYARS